MTQPRIALLCSGLGNIRRGHEVFARDLFDLLRNSVPITLYKGAGEPTPNEIVIEHIPRFSPLLEGIHVQASARWRDAAIEQERMRIEGITFAYSALPHLIDEAYDIVHCLEREVCEVIYANRHLFSVTPKIVFSNGGAIPAFRLPPCDFVQEYTDYNRRRSARKKAFVIPHGVDTTRFRPDVPTDFRNRMNIPSDAFVALSVGTICHWHKRMDHVIREVAQVPDAWLVIVGQESPDSAAIREMGHTLMRDRIVFTSMPHDELPAVYAAADVFVLGSLFETFGIVYIEAMAAGLPVFCTNHPNQRSIVQEGVFVDMRKPGALSTALRNRRPTELRALGQKGREIAVAQYDLRALEQAYLHAYERIARSTVKLPAYGMLQSWRARTSSSKRRIREWLASFRARIDPSCY